LRTPLGLLEFCEDLFQGVQIIGDGPVKARFTTASLGQGDGDALSVDIEAHEQ
jgi:hypothetical protein